MKLQTQHRLPVFIALSLMLHLIWLIGQQTGTSLPSIQQQDSCTMSVHINEVQTAKPDKKILTVADKNSTQQDASQPKPATTSNSAPEKNQTKPEAQDLKQLAQAKIIGQIRNKMVQHFVYPRLARRQGWQGQVLLGFQLDTTGSIQNIHVKQSSGYAILDNSAITALHKIGKVEHNAAGFFNKNWRLEIPIIYRLEG